MICIACTGSGRSLPPCCALLREAGVVLLPPVLEHDAEQVGVCDVLSNQPCQPGITGPGIISGVPGCRRWVGELAALCLQLQCSLCVHAMTCMAKYSALVPVWWVWELGIVLNGIHCMQAGST